LKQATAVLNGERRSITITDFLRDLESDEFRDPIIELTSSMKFAEAHGFDIE